MKFTRNDYFTKQAARKGGAATASKWARIRLEKERAESRQLEEKAFEEFEKAEEGIFNGFAMVNVFHERVNKLNAILVDIADQMATCHGVSVGEDEIMCYFFTEPEKVKKQVRFNRSVYLF